MNRLRVGDLVQIMSGRKVDKGKRARIVRIFDDGRLIVDGINTVTRNMRPNARQPQGERITKEAPIHSSKVMPIDETTDKPTRVRVKVENGKKARVGKSGAALKAG